MKGVIVRLNQGFGFIRGDDGVERFFHVSGLEQTTLDFDALRTGMKVRFEHLDAPKGPRAYQIAMTSA